MKRDVYKHEERYKTWKTEALESGIDGLAKKNSDIIIKYVLDMEIGKNISNKNVKGARSFPRLNNLRQRMRQVVIMLQNRGIDDITAVCDDDLIRLFSDMRSGVLKTKSNEKYRTAGDYAKVFTAFWHWWMKSNRREGQKIEDITEELDKTMESGRFVFLTKEKLDEMLPYFDEDEQIVLLFTFDSLIRAPTELLSLRVKDIFEKENGTWVNVPAEISKTKFERRFNLLYSGNSVKEYLKRKKLNSEDYLFNFNHHSLTEKMHKVAKQLWGDAISDPTAGGKYSELSLYDLRHSGTIHLRLLASKNANISIDSIRQRAGWKDFKMLNYYTKFIGLDGSIDKNELLIQEDKSKLEKELDEVKLNNKQMANKFGQLLDLFKRHPEEMSKIAIIEKEKLLEIFR